MATYQGALRWTSASTLRTDRFGLTTGTVTYMVRAGADRLIAENTHPFAPLYLEGQELDAQGPFWEITGNYVGIFQSKTEPVYELNGTSQEDPIETHPDFDEKMKEFAEFDNDYGTFVGFDKDAPNKLVGVQSYLVPGAIWRVTHYQATPPSESVGQLGRIATPDGPAPRGEDGANWLFTSYQTRQRGQTWEIVKEWRLSGRGGWNTVIYGTE